MRSKYLLAGLLASTMLCVTASAQQQAPAPKAPAAQAQTTAPVSNAAGWRSSKLIGLNIYNPQNEKIGDINEVLLDSTGKTVTGYVIGVGGFLGMGEHDVLMKPDQLKFVNEPVRTSSATTTTTRPAPANTTGTGTAANTPATTTTTPTTTRPARAANEKWYPDHAVINSTKDQLKAMPQFKYN